MSVATAKRRIKIIKAPSFSPLALLSGFGVLWHYRDLLYTLSVHRIKVRYKQSILGILWAVLQPLSLMLIYTLVSTAFDRWQQPTGYSSTNLQQVLFYYALFLAIDWISACFAFILERKERWRLLWWLFLQRFCYRQVMYYVMIKSVTMAVRGPVVGWGKLERKATAEAQP